MKKHFYLDEIINICNNKHLSAEEIFLELKKVYPKVWQASVYRNIDKLVEQKKLKKISGIQKKTIYESTIKPHIHFVDQKTWKIIDIDFDYSSINIPIPSWFQTEWIEITIYGSKN